MENMKGFSHWRGLWKKIHDGGGSKASLTDKAFHGGVWLSFFRGTEQILGFLKIVVLARILSPSDFGLFGIAMLALSALETVSETGMFHTLVQKKGDIRRYLDTAWSINVIRSVVVAAILFIFAPWIAAFFDEPLATQLVRAVGLVIILKAAVNIAVVYFDKDMEFQKFFKFQASGTVVDVIVSITIALIWESAWALIIGIIAGYATRLIASYMLDKYRPKLSMKWQDVKVLWGFSKWLTGSSILVYILTHIDDVLVGRVLGATSLGFYQMSYRISNMPAVELTQVISKITLPAYSKIQDNYNKLRDSYLKVLRIVAFITLPVSGLIFILAHDITMVVFGSEWLPMVPALQVLALFGLFRSLGGTTGSLLIAIGRPDLKLKIQVGQLLMLLALLYPFTKMWGLVGTAWAVTAYVAVFSLVAIYIALRKLEASFKDPIKIVTSALIATLLMVWFAYVLGGYLDNTNAIVSLIARTVISGGIYCVVIYSFDKLFDLGVVSFLRSSFLKPLKTMLNK